MHIVLNVAHHVYNMHQIKKIPIFTNKISAMAIRCNECNRLNPDDAIYCGSCGTKLDIRNKKFIDSEIEPIERYSNKKEDGISPKSKIKVIPKFLLNNYGNIFCVILACIMPFIAVDAIKTAQASYRSTLEKYWLYWFGIFSAYISYVSFIALFIVFPICKIHINNEKTAGAFWNLALYLGAIIFAGLFTGGVITLIDLIC